MVTPVLPETYETGAGLNVGQVSNELLNIMVYFQFFPGQIALPTCQLMFCGEQAQHILKRITYLEEKCVCAW